MKIVQKRIGETPLECLKRHVRSDIKASYIGRLDPLAEGEMIILEGEECKEREQYLHLDKIYHYRAIIGIETDSLDMLGVVTESTPYHKGNIQKTVEQFKGVQDMKVPLYSAHTVQGKKLFWYAQKNQQVELPLIRNTVYTHTYKTERKRQGGEIADEALEKTALVHGQFRQKEIQEAWKKFKKEYTATEFIEYEAEIHVSTGTYIRSVIREVAKKLHTKAIASSIKRTKILYTSQE